MIFDCGVLAKTPLFYLVVLKFILRSIERTIGKVSMYITIFWSNYVSSQSDVDAPDSKMLTAIHN